MLALAAQAPTFASQWRRLLRQDLEARGFWRWAQARSLVPWDATLAMFCAPPAWCWGLPGWRRCWAPWPKADWYLRRRRCNPSLSRLSPATRLEQLFSLASLGRLLKSLLPAAAIVWLSCAVLVRDWPLLLTLPRLAGVQALTEFTLGRGFEVAWKSALVLLAWSGADYLIERQKLSKASCA